MQKNLALVIKTNQDFVRHVGDDVDLNSFELNKLFDSISHIYLPFLNMLERLEQDQVPFRISFVLTPMLCSLLNEPVIQEQYLEWVDRRIELGKKELERNASNPQILQNIQQIIDLSEQNKADFSQKYQKNLVTAFAAFKDKGLIELLATCGTEAFLPFYSDVKEVISAQIETGLHAFKEDFGEIPSGFYLPALGYYPGVEKIVRAYGFSYTILSARGLLLSETLPEKGIFYPVRTENSLAVFAADPYAWDDVFGDEGYVHNKVYCNKNQDIGFELPAAQLSPVISEGDIRLSTGYEYFNNDLSDKNPKLYNPEEADHQIEMDARDFIAKRSEKLGSAMKFMPDSDFASIICTFDAEDFLQQWSEGVKWVEQVIRASGKYNVQMTGCNQLLAHQYELEKVTPYYSAAAGDGYGENLLSSKNCWMMRYIHKACERMIDLSDRFPTDTGLKTRLLNLGAKELMLAMSLNLPKTLDSDEPPEYAERRFKDSIEAFTCVFDSLGSNTVSTEWLTTLEVRDSFFPWMNYKIFTKKR